MKRLLLTYDAPGWAFHGECLDMQWHLERCYPGRVETVIRRGCQVGAFTQYDAVYSSAWYDDRLSQHPRAASQLSSTSYWLPCEKAINRKHLLKRWRWLATKNTAIQQALMPEDHPAPQLLYHQINPERWPFQLPPPVRGSFRIGFAGHRQANKGPELIEAAAKLPGVELVTVEWDKGRLPQEEMPNWYHKLHAYICASKTEGGPRTGLEAMLCGVPIISTRVGQLHEMAPDGEVLFVDRTVEAMRHGIQQLIENSSHREWMSEQARYIGAMWAITYGSKWADFLIEVAGA